MTKLIPLLFAIFLLNFVAGCNPNKKYAPTEDDYSSPSPTTEASPTPEICQDTTWDIVIASLKVDPEYAQDMEGIYEYIRSCQISTEQANELINLYKSLTDEIQEKILQAINSDLIQSNKNVLDFYKNVAKSDKIFLAEAAIQKLVYTDKIDEILEIYNLKTNDNHRLIILKSLLFSGTEEQKVFDLYELVAAGDNRLLAPIALRGLTNASANEEWQDWTWNNKTKKILEETVEKDFYKLSYLSSYELLALANKYPNSQFTQACKEYRNFTEGVYFGQGVGGWGSDRQAVFRQPFEPSRELEFWPKFLDKYPGHPGSDDAMYRIARVYELKGDYETAILKYYQASQFPDYNMSGVASTRILFIIDLLMSSDSLAKFLKNNPDHPLFPKISYSKAIHLIREDKLSLAVSELENFVNEYQDKKLSDFSMSGQNFGKKVQEQIRRIKRLEAIRNQETSDESLYQEAAFWFNYNYLVYNHLWNGVFNPIFYRFMPEKWEGAITSTRMTITYDLVKTANKGYRLQNRHLKSIELLEQLLKDYPNSELAAEAKYSIALNYYYLNGGQYPTFTDQDLSWKELAVNSFNDFVKDFPDSSMADDALLTIADIFDRNFAPTPEFKEEAIQALKKIIQDYPNGDRYEEAEVMLNNLRN